MASINTFSGVNVVLVMAYGTLVFVLLFIFMKRQIMRFAVKSRRGPHVPLGHNAPKDLKEEIELRLSKVQDIRYEPQLLSEGDERLQQLQEPGSPCCFNYLYRMRALDAIRTSGIPFREVCKNPKSLTGRNFRSFLLDLRNASSPFRGVQKNLIDTLLDGYESARHGTGVFGETEYLKYQDALNELAAVVTARRTSSSGHKQPPPAPTLEHSTPPDSPPPSTIQVTYLPSSQKSKRPKHFLELKSFKDKYNTLESTL